MFNKRPCIHNLVMPRFKIINILFLRQNSKKLRRSSHFSNIYLTREGRIIAPSVTELCSLKTQGEM